MAGGLDWTTFEGPFQIKLFYESDSMKRCQKSHERDGRVIATGTQLCNPVIALEGDERTAAGCSLASTSAQHLPVFTRFQ